MSSPKPHNVSRLETIRQHWQDKSAGEIAAIIGGTCTRNAVLGLIHRHSVQKRDTTNTALNPPHLITLPLGMKYDALAREIITNERDDDARA